MIHLGLGPAADKKKHNSRFERIGEEIGQEREREGEGKKERGRERERGNCGKESEREIFDYIL